MVGLPRAVTRPTISGTLRALGLVDADGSAFYRLFSGERPDDGILARRDRRETLAQMPAEEPYAAVMDGIQVPLTWLLPSRGRTGRGRCRCRAMLWCGYHHALRGPVFHPGRAGTRGAWPKQEDWLHQLDALLGATEATEAA